MRSGTPDFIKQLVAANLANEIDQESEVVDIELFCIKDSPETKPIKFDEGLSLQLWFRVDDQAFQAALESIDSTGNPRYLSLFQCKTADKFRAELVRWFTENKSFGNGKKFADIIKILRLD